MPELGPYGFVRGARGNSRPYRDPPRGGLSEIRVGFLIKLLEPSASYAIQADLMCRGLRRRVGEKRGAA